MAAVLFFCGIHSSPTFAAKTVLSSFGEAGSGAGQFGANAPAGTAVNTTGAGGVTVGDLYVADRGGNRIEEFHADGTFVRAFGAGVGGAEVDVCVDSCVAGAASSAAGGLANPWGVAVDQTTGAVYVTGLTNRRVDVFSALGEFEGALGFGVISNSQAELQFCTGATGCVKGLAGAAAGQLGTVQGFPAVAPAGSPDAGDVFVADFTNARIAQYTPTISEGRVTGIDFDKAFGGGVADGSSAELQTCTTVCFKGTTGSAPGQFAANAMFGIAVGGAGDVYAVDAPRNCADTCRVEKFDPTASTATDFAPESLTFTAGTSQAQAAFNVAIDPATQDVLVAQATAGETRIPRFDPGGEPIDVSAEGSGIPAPASATTPPGLAAGLGGDLYLTSPAAARVYLLNTPSSPGAAISPVTEVGSRGATFNGTVTPVDGVDTRYRFEYSTNGVDWTQAPVPDVDAGSGPGAVEVHRPARELTPNTSYQVRLRADNGNGAPAVSAPTGFTTGAAAPTVLQEAATSLGTVGAVLSAYVKPENSPTTYRFEWGPTSAYGKLAPVEFTPFIGSGGRPLRVEAEIDGLRPGATYHFRLIATSPAGRTEGVDSPFEIAPAACPNEGVRGQSRQDPSTGRPFSVGLPECRAYEMVTPLEKGGIDVQLDPAASPVAPDGDAIGFDTIAATADPGNFVASALNPFLARRSATGWTNTSSFAPAGLIAGASGARSGGAIYSADLSRLAACGGVAPSANAPGRSLACAFRAAAAGWLASPTFANLSGQGTAGFGFIQGYFGGSADLSSIVFQASTGRLHLLPADDTTFTGTGGAGGIYELTDLPGGASILRLVDVGDDGRPIGPGSGAYLGSAAGTNTSTGSGYQAVSADGRTIYFTATPTGGVRTLYARTSEFAGGTPAAPVTVALSDPEPSECPGCPATGGLPDAPGSNRVNGFLGASGDGARSFFLTDQELLPSDTDQGVDLYSYDLDAPAGGHLTQLSVAGAGDPSPGSGADVKGVVRVSPTGSRVYFVAGGVLTDEPAADGSSPDLGADNLYCWRRDASFPRGHTAFLATLPAADSALWAADGGGEAQTTPDGRYLLFGTTARLSPADTDDAADVYRYDSGTGDLLLISTGSGAAGARIGPFPSLNALGAQPDVNLLTRAITDDGSTIVFSTAAALQGEDVNGADDVYAWHEGDVALVSDGESPAGADPRGSIIAGAGSPTISPSGSDIFFTTRTPLVGTDTDSLADVYDARIGGGFPFSPPVACTDGAGCRGPLAPAPPVGEPASATWSGPGNQATPKPARPHGRHRHKKHRRKHGQRKHARHGRHPHAGKRGAAPRRGRHTTSERNGK
jgi:hypothetical protein